MFLCHVAKDIIFILLINVPIKMRPSGRIFTVFDDVN